MGKSFNALLELYEGAEVCEFRDLAFHDLVRGVLVLEMVPGILGEMLELGDESERLHREVGAMLAGSGTDILIGIGELTRGAIEGAVAAGMDPGSALFFETKADAKQYIGDEVRQGDVVLVKGSRLAGLEEICDFLKSTVQGRA